jgi:heme/copper-type cytochrome/quinol oxidase subunit 2
MDGLNGSLGILFTVGILLMVVGVFCYIWLLRRVKNGDDQEVQFNGSEHLLIYLTILAIIAFFGSGLLLLFASSL